MTYPGVVDRVYWAGGVGGAGGGAPARRGRPPAREGAGGAEPAARCAGAAAGGGCVERERRHGSRSPGSSISKNSRAVKPPLEATTEFGKIWIFVL